MLKKDINKKRLPERESKKNKKYKQTKKNIKKNQARKQLVNENLQFKKKKGKKANNEDFFVP